MKVILTIAQHGTVKAGTEVFISHLEKTIPNTRILDYTTLSRSHKPAAKPSLLKEPLMARDLSRWFMEAYDTLDPEIVITNGLFGWALPPLHIPTISIQHGTYAAFADTLLYKASPNYFRTRYVYSFFEKRSAQKSTAIVANSSFTQRNIRDYYHLESRMIHNAIDTDTFSPLRKEKARDILGLSKNTTIGLFVGRPDTTKGFDILTDLALRRKDILFLCVLFPGIHPPSPNMRIFPSTGHAALQVFYSAADFCINPSRFEGFGYVPLESLACNTPVLTSKTGIFSDLSLEGALVAETNNADTYSSLLHDIPEKTRSRKEIERRFSLKIFKKNYTALIQELLRK